MSQSVIYEIKTTPAAALSSLVFTVTFLKKIGDIFVPIAVLSNISKNHKITVSIEPDRYYIRTFAKGQPCTQVVIEGNGVPLVGPLTIDDTRIININNSFLIS